MTFDDYTEEQDCPTCGGKGQVPRCTKVSEPLDGDFSCPACSKPPSLKLAELEDVSDDEMSERLDALAVQSDVFYEELQRELEEEQRRRLEAETERDVATARLRASAAKLGMLASRARELQATLREALEHIRADMHIEPWYRNAQAVLRRAVK